MRWRKLGRLYDAPNLHPKLLSHAANPLPVRMHGDMYRVFFSGRDAKNRSSVGFVDLDLKTGRVSSVSSEPAFTHGEEGTFYSHGVSIANCYEAGGRRYMLFMGWRVPEDGHWYGEIGRLMLGNDLSLRLDGNSAFLGLDGADPLSLSYPWVIKTRNGIFHMWYGSTLAWDAGNGEMLHVINHATSHDGHQWDRCGLSVPYVGSVAQAFSRPTVVHSAEGGYDMWFSYRGGVGKAYRIGHAVSRSGERWELRLRDAGIDVAEQGWDSEMIEYPFVFDHDASRYMLYCGNGYGKSGFGLAILES
jgi:hypothetical protein